MSWKTGLLLFAICWALQIAGTMLQMRHYRRGLGALEARWTDGYIGSGSARARFGRGAIMILVVSPAGIVRDALLMQGLTVWAKFKPMTPRPRRARALPEPIAPSDQRATRSAMKRR